MPPDFDRLANQAVQQFWTSRGGGSAVRSQGGSRDAVIGGKNMDGFYALVSRVAAHCRLPASAIYTSKKQVILPGYFRATKNWDVLVIHRQRLLAVFEFKSQVGSFGNNFNNRSEEVIGSAADLWVAHRHGAYQPPGAASSTPMIVAEPGVPMMNPDIQSDPRPPFLAWLMLLEDSPESRRSVRADEAHYPVFPEFRGASYARRYQLLCERLMERKLYGSAALILSDAATGGATGAHTSLSDATSLRAMFGEFAGKVLAALA